MQPLQAVLAQLEELRSVNRRLRGHAHEFGWEWEPALQSLVVSRSRRGAQASLDRQEERSGSPKLHRRASRPRRPADAPLMASDREEDEDREGEEGKGDEGRGVGGAGFAAEGWSVGAERDDGPARGGDAACLATSASKGTGRRRKRSQGTNIT